MGNRLNFLSPETFAIVQVLYLFVSIVLALTLARKIGIGLSLLIASLILGILTLGIGWKLLACFLQIQSFEIMLLVFLTYTLANLMDKLGMLEKLSRSLEQSFGSISISLIPLLIGLIPMPAGALVSASMLSPLTKDSKIGPERITIINYWFRHIWTPVWPLYPSVIIALVVLGMQYEKYLLSTFPIAIVSFLLGLTLLKDLNFEFRAEGLKDAFINIYPILALLLIYLIFRNLIVAVMVSILIVILHKKVGIEDLKLVIKKAFDLRILALVFAVIGYKNIIEFSKSAEALYEEISFMPVELTAFVLFFLVGFSTGIELSYSSIALPIFREFAEQPGNLLLAISAGFFGVMLSPFHLCYALTVEFFRAELGKCYRILLSLVVPALVSSYIFHLLFSFFL